MSATELQLPAEPASVRAARDRLRAVAADVREEVLEAATLALSELVSNAILHAHGTLRVIVDVSDPCLRVEVHDPSATEPTLRPLDPEAVNGRGLRIVAALADRWGTQPTLAGKVVWFELDRDGDQ